ncbi:MAG TPA: hypothetical protein VLA09_02640 [Longimicrobiales bacterium]|nr:hypothetical protein [Longimicrobiales bacterium]
MSPRYVRNRPERGDDLAAALVSAALAASVGLITFYFARLVIAREPVGAGHEAGREVERAEE